MLLIPKKELDRVGGNVNAVDSSVIIDTDDPEDRADLFFNTDELISIEQAKADWENSHSPAVVAVEKRKEKSRESR